MTMPLVVEYFDDLLATPEDADQLNRSILHLSMQGKLVSQNPNDEAASILIGKIYTRNNITPLEIKDEPFVLPSGWAWSKLGWIISLEYGDGLPKTKRADEGKIPVYGSNGIVGYHTEYLLDKPCIVIGRKGSSGAVNLSQDKSWVIDTAYYVIPPSEIDLKFLFYLLKDLHLENLGKGIKPGLNRKEAYDLVVGIPPLAEQQRIVARVEELFVQTRALAKELAHSQSELDGLNKSALSHLLASETPDEFNQHWDFIAENFDLLFQTPDHVAPLRQSILELAVRGKLTRREAGDESAGELFKRINKEKPLPPIEENEKPFDLPEGWEWVILENIVSVLGDGLHGTPEYADDGEYFFVNGNNLSDGKIVIKKNTKRVSQSEYDKYKKELNSRTVFVSINGTIGNLAFYNNEKIILGKSACYFNLLDEVDKFYIGILIRSPYFLDYARMVASRTTISNVSLKSMRHLIIPLPSLAEQERIVKRVEQLLSLCDALEGRFADAARERGRLVAAVMSTVGG